VNLTKVTPHDTSSLIHRNEDNFLVGGPNSKKIDSGGVYLNTMESVQATTHCNLIDEQTLVRTVEFNLKPASDSTKSGAKSG